MYMQSSVLGVSGKELAGEGVVVEPTGDVPILKRQ